MTASIAALAVLVLVLVAFARRRSGHLPAAPGEPLSPLHGSLSRKQTKQTRAALDAATHVLK